TESVKIFHIHSQAFEVREFVSEISRAVDSFVTHQTIFHARVYLSPIHHHNCLFSSRFIFAFNEAVQLPDAARVPELSQGLCFELPDSFACDLIDAAYLFERMAVTIDQAETHLQNLSLTR